MVGRNRITGAPSAASGPALGQTRVRVLETLQQASRPRSAAEVAAELGLHVNTARFHLQALVGDGLVERASSTTGQPGRPTVEYRASADAPAVGQRSYRLLAEILAGHLAAHSRHPSRAAAAAGAEWGRSLAGPPEPFVRVSAARAARQLLAVFEAEGFAPELEGAQRPRALRLHHCPFREIATRHGEVVCSLHLGLARGLLAQLGAPFTATEVTPFVTATECVIELGRSPGAEDQS